MGVTLKRRIAWIGLLLVGLQISACASTSPTEAPGDWTVVADLPFDIGNGAIVEAVNGGVLVLQTDLTVLIGLDGSWRVGEVSPLPIPHSCCGTTDGLPAGDTLVLISEVNTETWLLDVNTLSWRQVGARPTDGYVLGSALIEGHVFVLTAAARTGTAVSHVAALEVATGEWRALEAVPSPISVGGATTDGTRFLVAGTQQGPNNNVIGDRSPVAYQYTPDEGWTALPSIPIDGQASTVVWVERVGLLAWNYDLESALLDQSGEWRVLGSVPMPFAECYPRSFTLLGEAVAICGGVALFDPIARSWQTVPSTFDTRYVVTHTVLVGFARDQPGRTQMLRYSTAANSRLLTPFGVALAALSGTTLTAVAFNTQ